MKNIIPHFIQKQYQQNNLRGCFSGGAIFVDISGFTRTTETLIRSGREEGVEILSEMLQFYFTPPIHSVYAHGGFITHFAGDAFTAVFPLKKYQKPVLKHMLQAVNEINQFFNQHKTYQSKYGQFEFGVKIGMGFGEIEWGIVGSKERCAYYFRGEAIENAVKAEHHAQKGEIWIPENMVTPIEKYLHKKTKIDQYYQIQIIYSNQLPKPQHFNIKALQLETLKKFFDDRIIAFEQAEFRQIVSIFLAFDDVPDLDAFIGLVLEKAQRYGGITSRLDYGDKGKAILFFFGVPIFYENTAIRALEFILLLRQKIDPMIKLRIGITSGISYCGFNGSDLRSEFTCLGNAVNQSARFMMKAEWEQFLVGEEFTQYSEFFFNHLGDFVYKGREAPIPTYQLICKETPHNEFVYTSKMVGRQPELKRLETFIQPLKNHQSAGAIVVYGEPGIGKTRLVYEFQQITESRHIRWVHCVCDEILRESLNPFSYFLKKYFNQSPSETDEQNKAAFEIKCNQLIADLSKISHAEIKETINELNRTRSFLAGMINLNYPGSLFEELEPKLRFSNIIRAFKNFIKALALSHPLIIFIDDLQWIDQDSQTLLKNLTTNIENYPIAIIFTSRYCDDGSKPTLKLEFPPQEINLNYLSLSGIQDVAEHVVEGRINNETTAFIQSKTNGNPFFVEQLVLNLKEQQLIVRQNGHYTLAQIESADIPPTITGVLIARLDRLSIPVKRVVQTAAVLGAEFEVSVLQGILVSDEEIQPKIKQATRAAVWQAKSEISYIFRHALMRDAAYEMQPRARLRELHRLATTAFETIHANNLAPYYSTLAHHYEKAEIIDKTIRYLQKAGDRAAQNFQNKLALQYYDKLLSLLPEAEIDKQIRISLEKGKIYLNIGPYNAAEDMFQTAIDLAEKHDHFELLIEGKERLALMLKLRGDVEGSLSLSKELLSKSIGKFNKVAYANILNNMGRIYDLRGEYDQAMKYLQQALEIITETGNETSLCSIQASIGSVLWHQGKLTEAMQCHQSQLEIVEKANRKNLIARTLGQMGIIYKEQLQFDKAIECYQKKIEIDYEIGNLTGLAATVGNMGAVYFSLGDYQKASKYYQQQITMAKEVGNQLVTGVGIGNIGITLTAQKKYDSAINHLDQAIAIHQKTGFKFGLVHLYQNKATCLFFKKEYKQAEKISQDLLIMTTQISHHEITLTTQIMLAKLKFVENKWDDAIKMLTEIQNQITESSDNAIIHYELVTLNNELKKIDPSRAISDQTYATLIKKHTTLTIEQHRQKAIELNREVYEKTKEYKYKELLEELQKK